MTKPRASNSPKPKLGYPGAIRDTIAHALFIATCNELESEFSWGRRQLFASGLVWRAGHGHVCYLRGVRRRYAQRQEQALPVAEQSTVSRSSIPQRHAASVARDCTLRRAAVRPRRMGRCRRQSFRRRFGLRAEDGASKQANLGPRYASTAASWLSVNFSKETLPTKRSRRTTGSTSGCLTSCVRSPRSA